MARTYAWPEKRKYPLDTRQQVHAAIAHFAQNRHLYAPTARARVGARIRARARGLGIHVRAF
jgi:hypothetical protein